MKDRELLELAALAAGMEVGTYKFQWYEDIQSFIRHEPDEDGISGPWNSLDDDADTLRLAMKLSLLIMPYPLDNAIRVTRLDIKDVIVSYGIQPDPCFAVRRAVTMAAAEIYKKMKK